MKLIRFRRLSREPETRIQEVRVGTLHGGGYRFSRLVEVWVWEIAFNEEHLWAKLNGEMAEIIMPAKSWAVRLWRRVFPLKGMEMGVGHE